MKTSVTWINDYLEPKASSETQGDALTACGFPFEGEQQLEDGEIQQEIEMSSNRGDCVCHAGLAREIAALTGRRFQAPQSTLEATGDPIEQRIRVDNREPDLCPLYTAHLITGVTVGPSPQWMQDRLRAIGQVPRNNLVDATNFVLFELGQPTHVFDLDLIEGDSIIIRRATKDEAFLPLGEDAAEVRLAESDLVIADASRAIALAGIKGGAETAVSEKTTDILIESATFDRVSVRNSSRRLGIASDSSYRFERGVHPRQAQAAAERLISLILELAGGTLHRGVAIGGHPIPEPTRVSMRPSRCAGLLGQEITPQRMVECLDALELAPELHGDEIRTTIPPHRLDLAEEIDLIEEVARINGYENLDVEESMNVVVVPEQDDLKATGFVRSTLIGAGFIETISHTLISESAAEPFLEPGRSALRVNDERAGGEPILRPSLLPSLLEVARRNRDRAGLTIRAFEIAAVFDQAGDEHRERPMLGLVLDGQSDEDPSERYRSLRGCVEQLSHVLLGDRRALRMDPESAQDAGWLNPGAAITLDGRHLGTIGLLAGAVADRFDARGPIAVAEFELHPLIERFPPVPQPHPLPSIPSIERDLSVLIDESTSWERIAATAREAGDELLESVEFITTWRGKRLGPDRKSVTLRLQFRDETRTLRHEEVDPQVEGIARALTEQLGGEIRS
ncbi:MAG: phenylalanine--tRNA ligase subunit beta [Planctomycetota bacterium]|nr:phenylalanine--tRNA ligase subunit beta [Planctomycetota bacterium]